MPARLRKVLAAKEVPYLITVLFVSLGWVTTYSVERMTSTWTLKLSSHRIVRSGATGFVVDLTNVTRDKAFRDVSFLVELSQPGGGKITDVYARGLPPAWEGFKLPNKSESAAEFRSLTFYPGATIRLTTFYEGDGIPEIRLRGAAEPLRVVCPSLETFLVEHELIALLLLVVGWSAAVLLLVAFPGAGERA